MRKARLVGIVVAAMALSPVPSVADFTTRTTVQFILDCMAASGGITDENLDTCVCRHDNMEAVISHADYEEGRTYERNRAMPGKKGAFFRDSKRGERMYEKLVSVREEAFVKCPQVRRVRFDRKARTD